jgi:choline dehydrogenase-like flavoprotein
VAVQPDETLSEAERVFREGAEGLGIAVVANRRVQTHCRVDSPEALHALLRQGVDPAGIEAVSVHAMGTCAMGGDPARHPVDPQGRVRGVEGLVVADASVLPSSPGINPQISIQALAARTATLLLERGGLT